MADLEWDPRKEAQNVHKHGIDFATALLIWDGPIVERIDDRREYGEIRVQAFGIAESRILTVIYTMRGEARRIISARRANARERTLYEEEITRRSQPPPN